jgi:integrase
MSHIQKTTDRKEKQLVSIFKRKTKLYLQYTVDEKRIQKSTGLDDTPKNRKMLKEQVIPKVQHQIVTGELSKKLNTPKVEKFEYYADVWLRSKEKLKSYDAFENDVRNRLYDSFKGIRIDQITRGKVKVWIDSLLIKLSPKRTKYLLNMLKAIIQVAVDYEHIESKPDLQFQMPAHVPTREMLPFTKDEVNALLNHADGWFLNMLATAFYTGMRTGELIALKWSDIDFDEGTIYINSRVKNGTLDVPKTKSSIRYIPILNVLKPYLINQRKFSKSLYVFPNPKGKHFYDTKRLRPHWIKLLTKVKFKHRVLYNTRHTFATNMLRSGVNMLDLAQWLGHKNISEITETYAKYLKNEHLKQSRDINPFSSSADTLADTMGQEA